MYEVPISLKHLRQADPFVKCLWYDIALGRESHKALLFLFTNGSKKETNQSCNEENHFSDYFVWVTFIQTKPVTCEAGHEIQPQWSHTDGMVQICSCIFRRIFFFILTCKCYIYLNWYRPIFFRSLLHPTTPHEYNNEIWRFNSSPTPMGHIWINKSSLAASLRQWW